MATRTKITPFARLLIFLIILVPLAYGGASYIRGEDPIANFKAVISGEQAKTNSSSSSSSKSTYNPSSEVERLKKENRELKEKVKELEAALDAQQSGSSSSSRQKWGQ